MIENVWYDLHLNGKNIHDIINDRNIAHNYITQ